VRVVSEPLRRLVDATGFAGVVDRFVTFSDYSLFIDVPVQPLPSDRRVAFFGAFEPYKGVDVLIEAWSVVCKRLPDCELVMAGEGPMRDEVEKRARTLGLLDRIRFPGLVPKEKVRAILDQSWALVLPSRSEGLPRIIIEAHARARPVVATRVGGIPELIEHGVTGRLCEPMDMECIAAELLHLLENREECAKMGKAAREGVLARGPAAEYVAGIERLRDWLLDSE
jgi:glycosyltransferase involved in cell wall biosynthesis